MQLSEFENILWTVKVSTVSEIIGKCKENIYEICVKTSKFCTKKVLPAQSFIEKNTNVGFSLLSLG